jgi:uncharacterized protein YgiM (DUF1202 family)
MSEYKIVKIFDEEVAAADEAIVEPVAAEIIEEEIINEEELVNIFEIGNVIKLKDDVKDINNKPFSEGMFKRAYVVVDKRGSDNEILVFAAKPHGVKLGMVHFTNVELIAEKYEPEANMEVSRFPKYICDVIAAEANIHAKPGAAYKVLHIAHKYDLFTVVDEKSGWAQLKNGGWIQKENIREVKVL